MRGLLRLLVSVSFLAAVSVSSAFASGAAPNLSAVPRDLQKVGIDQKLNGQVPLDLPFVDEAGKTVHLGDYLGKKPAILVLAYYECPMLCTFVLNDLGEAVSKMNLKLGTDYQVITVSINPKETPKLAAAKKATYVGKYVPNQGDGWHFLTGSQDSITKLAQAVGYRYEYDRKTGQYNHATDIMILTPQGKLSHYFMGISYVPRDLRFALITASNGKIGSPVDQLLIYCCNVDFSTGKYTASIWKIVQIFGIGLALAVGGLILGLSLKKRNS